jgi:hypothetical protein
MEQRPFLVLPVLFGTMIRSVAATLATNQTAEIHGKTHQTVGLFYFSIFLKNHFFFNNFG